MLKLRHAMSGTLYEDLGDGRVRVTRKDGQTGVFHADGQWIEGDVTQADLHMLVWVGGRKLPREADPDPRRMIYRRDVIDYE
jgi:hypothetical protein